MTAAEVRTQLRDLVNEQFSGPVPDARLDRYIQPALDAFNRRVGYNPQEAALTLVDGDVSALPATCMEVIWIEHDGKFLAEKDMDAWRIEHKQWRQAQKGSPKEFAVVGRSIHFNPEPSANAVTLTTKIFFLASAGTLADAELLLINSGDHHIIPIYAAALWCAAPWRSAEGKGYSETLFKMFEAEAAAVAGSYQARKLKR